MSGENLSFLDDGQSIASTVGQLHRYFEKEYSRYQIKESELISHLHDGSKTAEDIKAELKHLGELLTLFGVLSDSLSVANRVLHSDAVSRVLGVENDIYAIHQEDDAEQSSKREAARRRIANQ